MDRVLTWIELHPGLASWVQAVGSIAAIGATAWVTTHGTREARRAAWRKERDTLSKALTLTAVYAGGTGRYPHTAFTMICREIFKHYREADLPNAAFPTLYASERMAEYVDRMIELADKALEGLTYSDETMRETRDAVRRVRPGNKAIFDHFKLVLSLTRNGGCNDLGGGLSWNEAASYAIVLQMLAEMKEFRRYLTTLMRSLR